MMRSSLIPSVPPRTAGVGKALRHAYSSALTDTDYSIFRTLLDRLK
jgi:hypothetical protein